MKTIKELMNRELSRPEKVLLIVNCFLTGIVVGFFFAPIKKGLYCGNNNVSTTYRDKDSNIKKEDE